MFDELNKQLLEAKEKLREQDRIKVMLDETQKSLENEKVLLDRLSLIMKKEKADVDRLENASLTGLFYSFLGNKDDQLEKERQEYLAARLKYDRCAHTVNSLNKEVERLKHKLTAFGNIEEKYSIVLKKKEEVINSSGGEISSKLLANTENLAYEHSNIKELSEAIDAGNNVLREVEGVVKSLSSAKGWGTFDMLGGGIIATAVKHNKMDKARDKTHRVQELLHRFNRELKDVDVQGAGMTIDISSFLTFADYFFDNLITDWIVQSRIKDSLNNVLNLQDKVRRIVDNLKSQLKKSDQNVKDLQYERKNIINEAG